MTQFVKANGIFRTVVGKWIDDGLAERERRHRRLARLLAGNKRV
jgi:hypothetical protein